MKKRIDLLLILTGIGLLVVTAVLLLCWHWRIHTAQQKNAGYVHTIRTLLSEPQSAVPEERLDNAMPVLSIDQTDFVGLLELPRYGSVLPVCADWGNTAKYPCLFSGSLYDRTIQIGGTCQKGQYDFYREISVGDTVFFTDMEANRYAYQVADIRHETHADQAALRQEDAALTLFIQNVYAMDYIVIFCRVSG